MRRPATSPLPLRAIALAVVLVLLCGCSRDEGFTWSQLTSPVPAVQAEAVEARSERDQLFVTMPVSSGVWDPATNASQAMQGLMQLCFESPVRLDNTLKPQEQLVSWSPSRDGYTWAFTLREGVYFHDGTPLNATDIVKSLDRILAVGPEGPYSWVLDELTAWRAQDERTVIVTSLKGGYGTLYAMTFPVMRMPSEGYPLGTGPYRLTEYQVGESLELTAQEHWWRNAPTIKTVRALARESAEMEAATFELGESDLLRTRGVTTAQYRQAGVSSTQDYMTQGFDALFFNFDSPMMADAGIRSAIARAIDRQDIITNIYQNHAVARDTPIPPDSWLSEVRFSGLSFNAEAAYQALEDMGFVDVDADGVFDLKPAQYRIEQQDDPQDGKAAQPTSPLLPPSPSPSAEAGQIDEATLDSMLTGEPNIDPAMRAALLQPLKLLTNVDRDTPVRRDAALRIADHLRRSGLPVEVVSVDIEDMEASIQEGDYDMTLLGYQIPLSGDLRFLLLSTYEGQRGGNLITRFSDPILDAQLNALTTATSDTEYRDALLQIERRALEQLPFFGLYFRTGTLVTRHTLRVPNGIREERPFRGIEAWYFVKDGQD